MSQQPLPESQHQRWLKYGLNVTVATIVVIALAVLLMYVAQTRKRRFDASGQSINSLKDQTNNVIKDLNTKITLVSLYTRNGKKNEDDTTDYVGRVEDLLDEYHRSSNKIDVEFIDPITDFSKRDDLIKRVTERYGGEVKQYQDYVNAYPAKYEAMQKIVKDQDTAFDALPRDEIKTQDLADAYNDVGNTIKGFMPVLERTKQQTDRLLKQKPPDYKAVVDIVKTQMTILSAVLEGVIDRFETNLKNKDLPQTFKVYFATNLGHLNEVKKIADELVDSAGKLGELKLDSLKRSLSEKDSILVMSDKDLRVVPREKVWQATMSHGASADKVKPIFAGEQQITTAILSLTAAKKPKVVFMRPGGPPMATASGMFDQGGAPFSEVADRLREYNFDVLEKDYTGMAAMQAQMRGQPAPPEPSDADINDAIWVIVNFPAQNQMGVPMPTVSAKLLEHLANGGAALVLNYRGGDSLEPALSPWGIKISPDKIVLKQLVPGGSGREGNSVEQAERRIQSVFILKEFGDHLLTKPLRSLTTAFVSIIPVEITPKPGITATPIIPIPNTPPSWVTATSNITGDDEIKFDAKRGDKEGPIFGGAVAEQKNGARLVVIGSLDFAANNVVAMQDEELRRQGYPGVPLFPGNAELFANSIYWLAHMEPMIAISPAAMQIARIAPMSDTAAKTWNIGVLLIGLPGLVVVAGVIMYLARRD